MRTFLSSSMLELPCTGVFTPTGEYDTHYTLPPSLGSSASHSISHLKQVKRRKGLLRSAPCQAPSAEAIVKAKRCKLQRHTPIASRLGEMIFSPE